MSKIEWTEATWNPLAGCTEISPGCQNCYAAVMAHRLAAMGQAKYAGTTRKLDNGKVVWTGKIGLDADVLAIPLKRKKPTMYFVNSMSDLFHENVPDDYIDKVFGVMAKTYWHTFQVLTKRAERMASYLNAKGVRSRILSAAQQFTWPGWAMDDVTRNDKGWEPHLHNVWLGVSVEDQQRADERIPHLLKTPAAVRFLSCEPLLGEIDLPLCFHSSDDPNQFDHSKCAPMVNWVIVGGESGHGARTCHLDHVRSIVRQCKAAGVPVFVKQIGAHVEESGIALKDTPSGKYLQPAKRTLKLVDSKGGDMEEWPEWARVRQMPATT